MTAPHSFSVHDDDVGERVDVFIAARLGIQRSAAQRVVAGGGVRIDGRPARAGTRLVAGAVVTVDAVALDAAGTAVEASRPASIAAPRPPTNVQLDILYADDSIIVVAKPAGLVVHPGLGHVNDTLVDVIAAHFPAFGAAFPRAEPRPGIVHRLDADTSGVLVIARTPAVQDMLQAQFKARHVDKTYLLIARGAVKPPVGIIDAPLGRDTVHRQRMAIVTGGHRAGEHSAGGRSAVTGYHVAVERPTDSLVVVRLFTGRTHQIRVHLAAIGHPVVGDRVYGRPDRTLGRMALHAWSLTVNHPVTGARMTFTAPLPDDLAAEFDRRYGQGWSARAQAASETLAAWATPASATADDAVGAAAMDGVALDDTAAKSNEVAT